MVQPTGNSGFFISRYFRIAKISVSTLKVMNNVFPPVSKIQKSLYENHSSIFNAFAMDCFCG